MKSFAHQRRGLSLVEVILSLMIIAVSLTASLRALGGYAIGRQAYGERAVAIELANQLMAEINQLPYWDPHGNAPTIGLESANSEHNRKTFDDFDDYDAWDESPPHDSENRHMTQFSDYRQQVSVTWDTSLPSPPTGSWAASSFKRITVTISRNGKVLATLTTVRSNNNASN